MNGLTVSFIVEIVSTVFLIALPMRLSQSFPQFVVVVFAVILFAAIAFYVYLGRLASTLGKSWITWVGLTIITKPIGTFVAYFMMRGNIKALVDQTAVPPAAEQKSLGSSKFHLGGWPRVGILVSVAWLLVVVAYTIYEMRLGPRSRMLFIEMVPGRFPDASGIVWDAGPKIAFGRFFVACIGPILVGWFLAYVIFWAIRWVRAGFASAR